MAQNLVTVHLNKFHISVAEFSYDWNKFSIESFNTCATPEEVKNNSETINVELLAKIINELFLKATPRPISATDLILILDDSITFHHLISVPEELKNKEHEVCAIIKDKLSEEIPFNIEDLTFDYAIQNKQIGVLAISTQHLNTYKDLATKIDKKIIHILSDTEVYKSIIEPPESENEDSNIAIIEINEQETRIITFKNGIIDKTLELNNGLSAYLEATAVSNNINKSHLIDLISLEQIDTIDITKNQDKIIELSQNISKYLNSLNIPFDHIYFWGLGVRIPNLITILDQELKTHIELKTLWRPLMAGKLFNDNKDATIKINKAIANFGILVAATRLVIETGSPYPSINLLPAKDRSFVGNIFKIRLYKRANILTITLCIALIFYTSYTVSTAKFDLLNLEKQTQNFESLIYGKRYDDIKKDIVTFNNDVNRIYNLTQSIQTLPNAYNQILSSNNQEAIQLKSVIYDKIKNSIVINGIATDRKALFSYQSELKKIIGQGSVDSPLSNFDGNTDLEFTITLNLNPQSWIFSI